MGGRDLRLPAGSKDWSFDPSGRRESTPSFKCCRRAKSSKWSGWIGAGAFAGSRGESRPFSGVRLRLTGDQAHHFILNAEAVFLGSAIMSKRGREVECVSQAGRDPLWVFALRSARNGA